MTAPDGIRGLSNRQVEEAIGMYEEWAKQRFDASVASGFAHSSLVLQPDGWKSLLEGNESYHALLDEREDRLASQGHDGDGGGASR